MSRHQLTNHSSATTATTTTTTNNNGSNPIGETSLSLRAIIDLTNDNDNNDNNDNSNKNDRKLPACAGLPQTMPRLKRRGQRTSEKRQATTSIATQSKAPNKKQRTATPAAATWNNNLNNFNNNDYNPMLATAQQKPAAIEPIPLGSASASAASSGGTLHNDKDFSDLLQFLAGNDGRSQNNYNGSTAMHDSKNDTHIPPPAPTPPTALAKAYSFVERLTQRFQSLMQSIQEESILPLSNVQMKNLSSFSLVAVDDLVFLAERMLNAQLTFQLQSKPTQVDIGFHYTMKNHLGAIRENGLMSSPEQQQQIPHNRRRTMRTTCVYGDGIYTGDNPVAFTKYGDIGLIVARLKGVYKYFGSKSQEARVRDGSCDTVIGNKLHRDMSSSTQGTTEDQKMDENVKRYNEIVLLNAYQCVPLVQFTKRNIQQMPGPDAIALINRIQSCVQTIIDEFFNNDYRIMATHHSSVARLSQPPFAAMPNAMARTGQYNPSVCNPIISHDNPLPATQEPLYHPKFDLRLSLYVLLNILRFQNKSLYDNVQTIIEQHTKCWKDKIGLNDHIVSTRASNKRQIIKTLNDQLHQCITPQYWKLADYNLTWDDSGQTFSSNLLHRATLPPHMNVPTVGQHLVAPRFTNVVVPPSQTILEHVSCVARKGVFTLPPKEWLQLYSEMNHNKIDQDNSSAECPICLQTNSTASDCFVRLKRCGHKFHRSCIQNCIGHGTSRCPTCRVELSKTFIAPGKSPSGQMTIQTVLNQHCDGYPNLGTIQISYSMNSGIQESYHDNPGVRYPATFRTAYLPNCLEGQWLMKRLKIAFQNGLVFTVGTSLTSGKKDCITWASIHHKTSRQGGAFGYPDSGYFSRCNQELDRLCVPKAF